MASINSLNALQEAGIFSGMERKSRMEQPEWTEQ